MVTAKLKKALVKCIEVDVFINSYSLKHEEINFNYSQTLYHFSPEVFNKMRQSIYYI